MIQNKKRERKFDHKILIIGYGSVSQCTLPILLDKIDIPLENTTIIDFADKTKPLKEYTDKGLNYFREKITKKNMSKVLAKHVDDGGLIIDLAWNIGCEDILTWCHDHEVLYVNTSVEEWNPMENIDKKSPYEKSLYFRQMELRKLSKKWKNATTSVVDHGANPGLISHFVKQGLVDIGNRLIKDKWVTSKGGKEIKSYIKNLKFNKLAKKLGVKVIHCSERDTQITNKPKVVNEFVGTWSIEGLREEGTAPSEMGWGTHEKTLPPLAYQPKVGPKNQIFLAQMGMNTKVRSWIPDQEIVGMVIRHGEAFGISDRLTVWKGKKAIYRPTVHYAYMPCHETLSSLDELRGLNYVLPKKQRIMGDEITTGADILGALLMGHPYKSWWTGSDLSIEQTRTIAPGQNATTLQVAAGIMGAILWMMENPKMGINIPDDLPHDFVLKVAKPYLGKFISTPSDWTPLKNRVVYFKENPASIPDKKDPWQFKNFMFLP
jgi:homospermidine synthase